MYLVILKAETSSYHRQLQEQENSKGKGEKTNTAPSRCSPPLGRK